MRFETQRSKVSGTLYLSGEDHLQLLADAYSMFAHTNPMHSDVFPSVRRMEAEVVNMTASLLGKGEPLGGCGVSSWMRAGDCWGMCFLCNGKRRED